MENKEGRWCKRSSQIPGICRWTDNYNIYWEEKEKRRNTSSIWEKLTLPCLCFTQVKRVNILVWSSVERSESPLSLRFLFLHSWQSHPMYFSLFKYLQWVHHHLWNMVETSEPETKFLEYGCNLYFVLSNIYVISKEQTAPLHYKNI